MAPVGILLVVVCLVQMYTNPLLLQEVTAIICNACSPGRKRRSQHTLMRGSQQVRPVWCFTSVLRSWQMLLFTLKPSIRMC